MSFLKGKEGNVTIMTVLLIMALLPLFLFVIFDISSFQYVKTDIDDAVKRSANIATLSVNAELLKYGELQINENEAKAIGAKSLETNLTDVVGKIEDHDFEILISNEQAPHVVEINNDMSANMTSPYVQVKGSYVVNGVIGLKHFRQEINELYQVGFIKNAESPLMNTSPSAFNWNEIVNPYRVYEDLSYPFSMHSEDVELLGGTINSFSINFENLIAAALTISLNDEAIQELSYVGENSDEAVFSFYVPERRQGEVISVSGTVYVKNPDFPLTSQQAALPVPISKFNVGIIEGDIKEKLKVENHILLLTEQ